MKEPWGQTPLLPPLLMLTDGQVHRKAGHQGSLLLWPMQVASQAKSGGGVLIVDSEGHIETGQL